MKESQGGQFIKDMVFSKRYNGHFKHIFCMVCDFQVVHNSSGCKQFNVNISVLDAGSDLLLMKLWVS